MVSEPQNSAALRPGGALLLVLIHLAALQTVYVLAFATGGQVVSVLNVYAAAVVGPLVALYIGLNRYSRDLPTAAALGLSRPRGRQWGGIVLAVFAGAAVAPVASDVTARIVAAWPLDAAPEDLLEGARTPGAAMVVVLVAGELLARPFVEELLFRGFLQRKMTVSVGARRAFAWTVALYTAFLLNPRFAPAAMIVGIVTGVLVWAFDATWVAIAAHVAFQAAPFTLAVVGCPLPSYDSPTPPLPPAVSLASVGATTALLAAAARWRIREVAP